MRYFLYGLGGIAGLAILYAVTATFFLLTAKLEKDKDGCLVLDSQSWHFKFSFPFLSRYYPDSFKYLFDSMSICGYFVKFFWMLYFGWPILVSWLTVKTLVYAPFMLSFGYYPIANLKSMSGETGDAVFWVNIGEIKWVRYFFFPLVYGMAWKYWPANTYLVSFWVVILVICLAALLGPFFLYDKLREKSRKNEGRVSLVGEWFKAKKRRVCPLTKIKDVA